MAEFSVQQLSSLKARCQLDLFSSRKLPIQVDKSFPDSTGDCSQLLEVTLKLLLGSFDIQS